MWHNYKKYFAIKCLGYITSNNIQMSKLDIFKFGQIRAPPPQTLVLRYAYGSNKMLYIQINILFETKISIKFDLS